MRVYTLRDNVRVFSGGGGGGGTRMQNRKSKWRLSDAEFPASQILKTHIIGHLAPSSLSLSIVQAAFFRLSFYYAIASLFT